MTHGGEVIGERLKSMPLARLYSWQVETYLRCFFFALLVFLRAHHLLHGRFLALILQWLTRLPLPSVRNVKHFLPDTGDLILNPRGNTTD